MTKQEIVLWQYIKNRQILGVKFRRQAIIGDFICDFASFEKRIVIEIDGGQHNFGIQKKKDIKKDNFLKSQGFTILRFWNNEITDNISGVISVIEKTIATCPPLVGGPKSLISRRGLLFIPCLNPDGMQLGKRTNANGVDLNRNFDAGWYEFIGSPQPSPERYKGTFPGSEPEAASLISLTRDYHLKRAISYHTCGALIYWYFKQSGKVLEESQKFANEISYTKNTKKESKSLKATW